MAMHVSRQAFEEMVLEQERAILALLPEDVSAEASHVLVEVRDRPTRREREELGLGRDQTLLGLFVGVPLVERHADSVVLQPDRIVLYWEPIQSLARGADELRDQIRETLVHELAHYFGRTDEELARMFSAG
ncbi:MAG: metallopeptidase family protein [Anaerolineales bacterium]|jgi:predicted Zn-dependent protease with MMP-like domain